MTPQHQKELDQYLEARRILAGFEVLIVAAKSLAIAHRDSTRHTIASQFRRAVTRLTELDWLPQWCQITDRKDCIALELGRTLIALRGSAKVTARDVVQFVDKAREEWDAVTPAVKAGLSPVDQSAAGSAADPAVDAGAVCGRLHERPGDSIPQGNGGVADVAAKEQQGEQGSDGRAEGCVAVAAS